MKTVVIAEKPSVGRDIARVLNCSKKINGAIEGEKYIVTWGLGHLVTLADPEVYNKDYKEWKMEQLPMLPEKMEFVVMKQTGKQFQAVKTQLNRGDVKDVIIATDAGREGELVARLILLKAHCKKPMARLWISSVTDKAIRDGFAHLKDAREYNNLYMAALARAESDWLVGINATRALTCKYNASLSCGRVQTPTLAMIAKREEEIKEFVPKPYYGIRGVLYGMNFTWVDTKTRNTTLFDKRRIEEIYKKISSGNHTTRVVSIKKALKKQYAKPLYDLTELQRDANTRYNFSAKETLNIMQRLYENHKVLTYPRTDSRYITTDVVPTIPERLRACAVGPYKKMAAKLVNQKVNANASFVNNEKVSDHHAIIPTEQFVQLDHMSSEERKIYDLVVKRFLSVLYPPFVYEQTSIAIEVEGELFETKVKVVKELGFRELFDTMNEEDEEEKSVGGNTIALPNQFVPLTNEITTLEMNRVVGPIAYKIVEGKTAPPSPFNEATLLSAMENPVKYMSQYTKEAAKTLGETGGLGTVATRADIIDKLFSNFLLEKRGKDIYVTSKAKQLLKLVPEDLTKPELTADWEMKLSKIAKGSLKKDSFMNEIQIYTKELISEIKRGTGDFLHDNITNKKCPVCGKRMLSVSGKNNKMLVCQDRECGHREVVSRTSNARCPVCHKKMEITGEKDAQTFRCSCGYREKLSAFKERRNKEGANVSKREVNNYLKRQQKEVKEPINNAFAEAFAKLNL